MREDRNRELIVVPSILSADPLNIANALETIKDHTQWVHVDIMDGHFVPNLTFGPSLVKEIKNRYNFIVDVHLMVKEPEKFIPMFIEYSDYLGVHVEATPHIHRCLQSIRQAGKKAVVVLNPGTPFEFIKPVLCIIDMVLVMSVNPGFGGQKFLQEVIPKIKQINEYRKKQGLDFLIQVDGGVSYKNAELLYKAGCDVLVAGSSIFSFGDPVAAINLIKNSVKEGK